MIQGEIPPIFDKESLNSNFYSMPHVQDKGVTPFPNDDTARV